MSNVLWDVLRCNDIGQDVLKASRQRWGRGRPRGAPGHPIRTRASRAAPPPNLPSPPSAAAAARAAGTAAAPPRPPRAPAGVGRESSGGGGGASGEIPAGTAAAPPRPPRARPAPPPEWAESPAEAAAARRVKFQRRFGTNNSNQSNRWSCNEILDKCREFRNGRCIHVMTGGNSSRTTAGAPNWDE